jgi:PEP-CTERM motif
MRHSTFLSALAGLLLIAGMTAKAETFAFSFGTTGIPYWGSGTLTGNADPLIAGAFDISSATGTIDGGTIELAPPTDGSGNIVVDPSGLFRVDQVIYTGPGGNNGANGGDVGSVVDNWGLLFEDVNTGQLYNLFSGNPNEVTISSGNYPTAFLDAPLLSLSVIETHSVASTPEPSSFMLLGTGIFGAAGMLRRRMKA